MGSGLQAALAMVGAGAEAQDDAAEVDLFGDGGVPVAPRGDAKRAGRPKGARNKNTQWWREAFLSRFPSPLMGLGAAYSMPAADLARELRLTRIVAELAPGETALETRTNVDGAVTGYLVWDLARAFEIQRQCMVDVLPYVHSRQPLAIENKGERALGVLVIGDLGAVDGAGNVGALNLRAIEENQQVIDVTPDKSHDEKVARPEKVSGGNGMAKNGD